MPDRHFPLQLNWSHIPLVDPLIFGYKQQQVDNFTFMMVRLCEVETLSSSRVFTFITVLFEIHNALYGSTNDKLTTISTDVIKKSEDLSHQIDMEPNDEDKEALQVCSDAIMVESSDVLWKYLIAILYGLKADAYLLDNKFDEANKVRLEMLQLIHQYELFEVLDMVDIILDHCSKLLTCLWDTKTPDLPQIDYLLVVARYFLDKTKVNDDMDGLKYQNLRRNWYLIVAVNEGRFIDKSWELLEQKGDTEINLKASECIKLSLDVPEYPQILDHTTPLTKTDDFLERTIFLEEHLMVSHFHVNTENDTFIIIKEIIKYAQIAYETIQTKTNK